MAHFKSDLAKSVSLSSRELICYRIKKKYIIPEKCDRPP